MDNLEFVKYFKSINIYPKIDENSSDFTPATASIIDWIGRFDTYFQKKLNISNGEIFHPLFNREVSVHGDGILRYMEKIMEIASFSKSVGYGYSITLGIKETISNLDKVEHLIRNKIINSLGIIIEESDEIKGSEKFARECEMTLLKIADFKISIGLMASMETLYKLNVLSSPSFNSLIFTIYPINKQSNEYFDRNPITSCSKHFKILINEDGLIYSCLGLFGLKEYAMGSIYIPLEETFFETGKSKLDFKELISNGAPIKIEDIKNRKRITELAQMCELHRISLID